MGQAQPCTLPCTHGHTHLHLTRMNTSHVSRMSLSPSQTLTCPTPHTHLHMSPTRPHLSHISSYVCPTPSHVPHTLMHPHTFTCHTHPTHTRSHMLTHPHTCRRLMLYRSMAPDDEMMEGESSPTTPLTSLDDSSSDLEKRL